MQFTSLSELSVSRQTNEKRTVLIFIQLSDRSNWQDWGARWTRRNEFMRYLKTVLEELDMKYVLPTQPVLLPHNFPSFPGRA